MDTVIISVRDTRGIRIENKTWILPEFERRSFSALSKTERESTRRYLRAFRLDPPEQDGFLPKVEIFETFNDARDDLLYPMLISFSAPKLLYSNSVEEVSAGDFEQELDALGKSLAAGGIKIPPRLLESAGVRQVDFCKNALLPRDIRMQEVLSDLRRVDISKVVDVTEKEVKHGGQVLHIYAKTIERVFYDKVLDSLRPKAKRKDKGYMAREREIIDRYGLYSREIFRYEYRLKKWQAVRREVNAALGRPYQTEVTFKDLFSPGLCQKILLKSWRDLIGRPENQLALLGPVDDLALLAHIMDGARNQESTAHSMNRAFTSYGLAHAVRDHGAKEVRRTVFRSWNGDHSERLTEKLRTAATLAAGLPYSNGIAFVDGAIERCEWITRSSLKNMV